MSKRENINNLWIILLMTLATCALWGSTAVQAQQSDDPTATPNADGVIYAVVRSGDTLWAVVDRSGISMEEMLTLNNMTIDTLIHPGDLLIIGYVTPEPTATPPPSPTSTLAPPTAVSTALPPSGSICLLAFADNNQNGVYNTEEQLQTAVAFTIFNQEQVVGNYITDGISEPYCLDGLTPGEYKITRSVGRSEILTTAGDWTLTVNNGDRLDLLFGSYMETVMTPTPAATQASPPTKPAVATLAAPRPTAESSGGQSGGNWLPFAAAAIVFVVVVVFGGATAVWLIQKNN